MQVAKRYQDELPDIKQNIRKSYDYFEPNYKRYHEFRNFVFDTTLNADDKALLGALQKPVIEFNIQEAYISRLRGEFAKQEPSISVHAAEGAPTDPNMLTVVEGHNRAILFEANNDSFEYNVYTDLLSGGFSVMKIWTEYANEMSFNQCIRLGRVYDPTLCGFDIIARLPHKADGQYCFENFPKTVDEFKQEFGSNIKFDGMKFSKNISGFNWSYRVGDDDVVLVCDYYTKKPKKTKIVQLVNNQQMTEDDYEALLQKWNAAGLIQQPPAIKKERTTHIQTICRYRCIENQVLDYTETDFKSFPLVFVDGNSVLLRNGVNGAVQQMTRPYVYHAKGAQKLKNLAGQSLANELENSVQHKWKVAKESIPPEYTDAYTNNQVPNVLVYNAYQDQEQEKPLPPPQEVVRAPAPPEITNAFAMSDQVMQSTLGSYDASLGINDNQLSGVAIVEGATQSNAAAMPYVVGFLQGLNQASQIIVDLIPKYYVTPRTIPIVMPGGKKGFVPINQPGGIQLNYQTNALQVRVEAGVNFAIQKARALQQIIGLMQASPLFAQFMNAEGLEDLLDNLEIRGIDSLKAKAQAFMQNLKKQQAMQTQQPNPLVMKAQQEQQKMAQQQQQNQVENQLRQAEIANDAQANTNDRMKILLDAQQSQNENVVQLEKTQTEKYAKAVDAALKIHDQQHQHTKDTVELAHQILTSQQQQQSTGATQNG